MFQKLAFTKGVGKLDSAIFLNSLLGAIISSIFRASKYFIHLNFKNHELMNHYNNFKKLKKKLTACFLAVRKGGGIGDTVSGLVDTPAASAAQSSFSRKALDG